MAGIEQEPAPRILVVDDEALIRKVMKRYLADRDYIVDTADDGRTALEKIKENNYDLLLTDLKMPNMSGGQLLKEVAEKYPDIPKIVLTGYGTNEDIILALKTGAYDFLTKPITDFTILDHAISRAIERKHLSDERTRYIDELKQINEIVSMLNSGKKTEDIFHSLNSSLRSIIPFNRLALTAINKVEKITTTKLVASDRNVLFGTGSSFSLDESCFREAMKSSSVVIIDDLEDYIFRNSSHGNIKSLLDEGMYSFLILPYSINNQVRGFLIFSAEKKGVFKYKHKMFLESIAGQIAFSIQRGELLYEIEQQARNLEYTVALRTNQIIKTQKSTVFSLSKLAEARDSETGAHLERIRNYSVFLAQLYKYINDHREITSQYLRDIYDSSILHDIGKVGIPDGILLKEGFLNETEYEIMKTHTTIGHDALKSASMDLGEDAYLKMGMDITQYHHERWDGDGYPTGLKREEIPLSARIVTIADVYDALMSKRPYKDSYTHEQALEVMKSEGEKFDPELFTLFLDNSEEFNMIRMRFADDVEVENNVR